MKFKNGLLVTLLSSVALTSCTVLQKVNEDNNKAFVVNAFWVQDTLAKKNHEFRKINRMSPIVYKDTIIAGNAYDGLISYGMDSKNKNWRVNIPFGVEASGAAIKDRLFVGSNNGTMYSVDLSNGEIVWQFDTKSELVGEPLLNEGILYFVSGSQSLYAVDASNGRQLWIHNRQDTANNMTIRGGSKPSISNGLVYAGFSDGTLVAVNAKTGTEQWEITLNRNTKFRDIDASPVIDGDFIYINSYDDKIYCLSKDKGEIVWTANFGGASTPLVYKGKVFVVSSKGEIVALSQKDGTEIWKNTTNQGVYTEPALLNDVIVAGESQGKLQFFNSENGKKIGSFEPGRGVFSKPSIYGDTLYFISGEGNVYGITARYENKSRIYYLK